MARVDKLYPTWTAMGDSFQRNFLMKESRRGATKEIGPLNSAIGKASLASLSRLLPALIISMSLALIFALAASASGYSGTAIGTFNLALAYVPAIALTPFFFFFKGNWFHISMISFGLTPVILRDLVLHIQSLPGSQLIKSQTLSANTWTHILRVTLPQTLPRLIDATRVAMGLGWILLIASEFVIAQEGIGLRIWKLKRRYDVDNLLPIVLWVTLLAIAVDLLLWAGKRYFFPWVRGLNK